MSARGPYQVITLDSWREFVECVAGPEYRYWAFRGQADAKWQLWSKLSRHLREHSIHPRVWPEQEGRILRLFRRKAHLFLHHVPDEQDSLQWLALMQHHGAPTRLIDFTWSPYVAAFFALEAATSDAAVWALCPARVDSAVPRSLNKLGKGIREINPRAFGNYEQYFLKGEWPVVFIGEPYVMNQRLVAQSGTFAMPGVLDRPLEEILADYPSRETLIVKFVLPYTQVRDEAMYELYNMNITQATLFPDLDGLARSLAYELEFSWYMDPHTGELRKLFAGPA